MAPNKKQHLAATQGTADAVLDLARGVFGVTDARQLSASGRLQKSPARDVRNAGLDADRS